jgi:hypothetical protein
MANTDKNILITPARGSQTVDPNIIFSGANSTVGPSNITATITPAANGSLAFSGSQGNLLVIRNDLSNAVYVPGNLVVDNAITANTGSFTNVSGNGALLTNLNASNISGEVANALVAGTVYTNSQPNITSVGTLSSLSVSGNANVGNIGTAGLITATGNIQGGNVLTAGLISATGNVTGNFFIGNGSQLTGIVAITAQTVTTNAQPNITSVGTLTSLSVSGNANIGNIGTGGLITATANIQGGNLRTTGILSVGGNANTGNLGVTGVFATTLSATSNANVGNLGTAGLITATGNIQGGNLRTTGILSVGGNANVGNLGVTGVFATTLSATGNANVGNIGANNGVFTNVSGNGAALTSITGANVTGTVANATFATSAGSATTAGTVTTNAQPNITSVGTLTSLSVSGNANVGTLNANSGSLTNDLIVGGNLFVNGNLTYINVDTVAVEDPIIQLQTGPNGVAPTSNSGKDVGTALNYFDTVAKTAFMGWDTSNAEIAFGSNVSVANEIVTFTQLANIRSGNTLTTGVFATTLSATGNANVGNISATNGVFTNVSGNGAGLTSLPGGNVTGQVANALVAGTVTTNAQPNITSVGTLTSLSVSGNANLGNLGVTGVFATTLSATGNANVGNIGATNGVFTNVSGNGAALTGITANLANNISGGTQGQIPVQTSANVTGFVDKFTFSANTFTLGNANSTISPNLSNTLTISLGSGNTTVLPGNMNINGGSIETSGAANVSVNAGTLDIRGTTLGGGGVLGATGNAGHVNINGGSGLGNVYSNTNGPRAGNVYIYGGNTTGYALGTGSVEIVGGISNILSIPPSVVGNNGPSGGNVLISGGSGPTLIAGSSGTILGNSGGQVTVSGGNATGTGNNNGGNVTLRGGTATGSGTPGNVIIGGNNSTVLTVTGTGANISGSLSASGNSNVGNLGVTGVFATTLSATGNANVGNIGATNGVFTNVSGNGAGLTALPGGNVTGQVANALIAGTVYTNAQPNITSVGTLSALSVSGNSNVGNLGTAGLITATGNITAGNIIGIFANGTTNIRIPTASGNILANVGGNQVLNISTTAISVGFRAGNTTQGANSVAIGREAGNATQGANSVAIGMGSGNITQGTDAIAIGPLSGNNTQGNFSVAIGRSAGSNAQSADAVAIGVIAGSSGQGSAATAVGRGAGSQNQGFRAVAIGSDAGAQGQGSNSIAIGFEAGVSNQATNSIIINATGSALNQTTANTFTVKPVRLAANANILYYNESTGEISYQSTNNITTVGTLTSLSVSGNANLGNLGVTGIFATTLSATGNANVGNLGATNGVFTNVSGNGAGLTALNGSNITTGTIAAERIANPLNQNTTGTAATVTTNAQPNITSVGTLTGLSVTGNANVGNLGTAGLITATGNIQGNNILVGTGAGTSSGDDNLIKPGSSSAFLNVKGGSGRAKITLGNDFVRIISGSDLISFGTNAANSTDAGSTRATISNVGLTVTGTISATGNANVGNLGVGIVTATGNITAPNFIGNFVGTWTFANGTSNIAIPVANGNINFSVGGVANEVVFTSTGAIVNGTLSATGNANIGNIGTGGLITATGNIQGGNLNTNNNGILRVSRNSTQYLTIENSDTTTGPFIRNYSDNTNAKTIWYDARTDVAGTAPTAGSLGHTFAINGFQQFFISNVGISAVGNANVGNIGATNGVFTNVSGTLTTAAQTNITSLGTLTSVSVSGNANIANINLNSGGFLMKSVQTGISAAGTVQGNATVLGNAINVVSTVATGAGVRLPTAIAGMEVKIINLAANALLVYPATNGIINGLAANASYSLGANARLEFVATSSTQWYTMTGVYA